MRARRDPAGFAEDTIFELTASVQRERIPRVLWACLAPDLAIEPRVLSRLFLASPSLGLLLHPYDDRGMDLVGTSIEALRPAYSRFHSWLLDCDLERVRRTFEG